MKKLSKLIISFAFFCANVFVVYAQSVELSFTGRDIYGGYVKISQVTITNQTRGWSESLSWPDTTLLLINTINKINDIGNTNNPMVGQNIPNPFEGTTELAVNHLEGGLFHLFVYNVMGQRLSEFHGELPQGTYRFKIHVAQPQMCMVVAQSSKRQGSVKILNIGHGTGNGVEYVGVLGGIQKGLSSQVFGYGDRMTYVGRSSDFSQQSAEVTKVQNGSETIVLRFHGAPRVETAQVSNISSDSAVCGGNVTADGGASVIARGVCWSTSPNPTASNSKTMNGSGVGAFASSMTGLSAGTTYYVRAYATNSIGTAYGLQRTFSTSAKLPDVVTASVSDIASTTAICGGNVTSDGGAEVTTRGVCWSISPNPTIDNSHTTDGTGTGRFTSRLTELTLGTTYYVRAYATNSVGTVYGEEKSFTTSAYSCGNTITDYDGNTYNTIQIGSQCWMKENLKTTKYADGTSVSKGSSTSTTVAYWYYPNNNSSNKATYGLLYNWKAVMRNSSSSSVNPSGVQGICPTGWHVPSDAEWTQLTDYVGSQSQYQCNSSSTNIAKALASTTGWNSSTSTCAVGNTPSNNNSTGFGALPAGNYDGLYYNFGYNANFWSATEYNSNNAYTRYLNCSNPNVYSNYFTMYYGFSVRCLRDEEVEGLPEVSTLPVTDITTTTAICSGNVISDGGSDVIARGVCWSTKPNPTIADDHTTDGMGAGTFTSQLTGLQEVTTYYVRAYATNSVGTAYGEEKSFTTSVYSCGNAITDYDGNTYNTVQIGSQCWMKENLKTTKYADGTSVSQGSSVSTTVAYWDYPNNNSSNKATYGLLYNWKAVMRNSSSSSVNPSGVQGICPTGWHVPSDAEWTQLTDYVSSQSQYVCGNNSTYIAKALASTTGWTSSTNTCDVGNTSSSNNATGFGALPAGNYGGNYDNFGEGAIYWSATEVDSYTAYERDLGYTSANVDRAYFSKTLGFSVRCLRDEEVEGLPEVSTLPVSDITTTTAICSGNVISDGGSDVIARGVCWSTSPNPTIADNHTTDGRGTGEFVSNLTGLTAFTTYYVRAYATNSLGTAYGEERLFTTIESSVDGMPCTNTPSVTDIDGNTYNTVQIGSQCWMKENLKTTKYADGTSISQGSSTSNAVACWYYPNNNSSNKATYGLLYNWKAVMRNAGSSSATPSGVQGICPNGWHVPSDAEWTQLIDYVSSQSQYQCSSTSANIAKALASTTGWNSSTDACAVGNTPSNNNSTGFGALPAGLYYGSYHYFGDFANFWSATENIRGLAYYRYLGYRIASVGTLNNGTYYGISVRCLRNN